MHECGRKKTIKVHKIRRKNNDFYKTKGKLAINFTHPEAKATVDEKTSQNSTPKSSTNFRYSKSHKNPKYVH